jgi:hypothetical protein
MTKYFLTVEQCIFFKSIGFNNECLGFYFQKDGFGDFKFFPNPSFGAFFGVSINALIYEQAIDYLILKYDIHISFVYEYGFYNLKINIKNDNIYSRYQIENLETTKIIAINTCIDFIKEKMLCKDNQ